MLLGHWNDLTSAAMTLTLGAMRLPKYFGASGC
jgi:hypothetical protein